MLDWTRPVKHKKTMKINVLITAPDHKAKTMDEVQASLWAAEDEIKEKLKEINEKYKYLNFEVEGSEKFGVSSRGRSKSEGF